MDQRVQCPVCTLYLHNGMSLESHLDTHPKDQVIKALCSLSAKKSNDSTVTLTPSSSEGSYRSRTPLTDDSVRWSTSRRSTDSGYWPRTPSRNKSASSNVSSNCNPELQSGASHFENNLINNSAEFSDCEVKSVKSSNAFTPNVHLTTDYNQQYPFYSETPDESEVKYSRSTDYNVTDNGNQIFTYNVPIVGNMKLPPRIVPANATRGNNNFIKFIPKSNNMMVKNIGGVRYMAPSVKPYSMMFSGNSMGSDILSPKNLSQPIDGQFNQMAHEGIAPNATSVTQNSQIIYREMVHSVDGKPYISNVPQMLNGNDNAAQNSSMYQNMMVIDQFGNTSCMYNTPPSNSMTKAEPVSNESNKTLIIEVSPMSATDEKYIKPEILNNPTTTVSDKLHTSLPSSCKGLKILSNIKVEVPVKHHKYMVNTVMDLTESDELSYVQRTPSPENSLLDLEEKKEIPKLTDDCAQPCTSSNDSLITNSLSVIKNVGKLHPEDVSIKEDKMEDEFSDSCPVPDLICNEKPSISPCSELLENSENSMDQITSTKPDPSIKIDSKDELTSSLEIKIDSKDELTSSLEIKIDSKDELTSSLELLAGNNKLDHYSPDTSSDFKTKSEIYESGLDAEDLTSGSSSRLSVSPSPDPSIPESSRQNSTLKSESPRSSINLNLQEERKVRNPPKPRNIPLSLNNIFVKKHKKILKIKNKKFASKVVQPKQEPQPSSSNTVPVEIFFDSSVVKKSEDTEDIKEDINKTEDICNKNEVDADTEEQSMDIEPVAPSTISHDDKSNKMDILHIKEEVNTSYEFSCEVDRCNNDDAPFDTIRPINVITYGNIPADKFDDHSDHEELLDSETTKRNKQFVNMMSENYFGDNIYADYFTPDHVEAFDADKESNDSERPDDVWGEPSQKRNEFVLPNLIDNSYKIPYSTKVHYDGNESERKIECSEEPDNKDDILSESRSEGEPPLNICADEHMPPRGELSGQESNGDMESPWSRMYSEVTPTEPYDLIARESWVSDGSDVDVTEKKDNLDDDVQYKCRLHTCTQCGLKFASLKELRAHRTNEHVTATCSAYKTYSRMITARSIKKEEKINDNILAGKHLFDTDVTDPKAALQEYDILRDCKPEIKSLIKQEKKRKRNFICEICKIDQGNDVAFNEHLKLHPLECQTCGKRFYRRANLSLHMKTHLGIKNYK
ncbi:uncharacterized protein LOC126974402 isoform X2 [Leptidea sinapis]|nr:uncharacterized protein LOC126974402 isoform X2 [Leptidea sinapis]